MRTRAHQFPRTLEPRVMNPSLSLSRCRPTPIVRPPPPPLAPVPPPAGQSLPVPTSTASIGRGVG